MIFAFTEDGTLALHATLAEVQREYEGIDVESGAVCFYAADGTPLTARFTTPNRHGKLFGWWRWSASGHYDLVPDPGAAQDPFARALADTHSLAPNPWYASLAAVRAAVRESVISTADAAAPSPRGTVTE